MAKNYEVEIERVHYFDVPAREVMGYTLPPTRGMQISWYATVGWGQLTIHQSEDGSIEIDSECMSKEFVKQVLEAYTRYILDRGVIIE